MSDHTQIATRAALKNGLHPRILHVMLWNSKFVPQFIDFAQKYIAKTDSHLFFILEHLPTCDPGPENTVFAMKFPTFWGAYFELARQMRHADKIIIHNLFSRPVVRLLAMQPWLLRKCYWVMWGGDLYSYAAGKKTFTWRIHEIFRRSVIRNIGHLVTYVEGDVKLARQWYGARGQHHECLMYPSNLYIDHQVPAKVGGTINIQIGNSADPGNEHYEILKSLEPYKNEDIRIFAPLSYGDGAHARAVAVQGEKLFGDKFIPITEFQPLQDFISFLGKIDIAVFNHRRQQAMGNIITLLGLGKKVYLRKDVTSWAVFESKGIRVYDRSAFCLDQMDHRQAKRNMALVRSAFSPSVLEKQWQRIFE